jgi:hypothetical protein
MAGFVNGLGSALGSYARNRLVRNGGIYGWLGQHLPGGSPTNAPPPAPQMGLDASIPADQSAMTPPPVPDAGAPPMDDSQQVAGAQPMAHGGMVVKPTVVSLAEKGPEIVMPMGRYRGNR